MTDTDYKKRLKTTVLVLAAGAALNLGIAIMKLYVALSTNSVVILLDASNSFLDIATGAITVFAVALMFRQSGKDNEFGYGRAEYIAGFVVAAVVIVLGGMFMVESLNRLSMPEPIWFSLQHMGIVIGALAIKIVLLVIYKLADRKIHSSALGALVLDSGMDVAITAVTVISFSLSARLEFAVDAVVGIVMSVLILIMGVKMIIASVKTLMGVSGTKEQKNDIAAATLKVEGVCGVGKIKLHDYGFERVVGTVEIAVSEGENPLEVCARVKENVGGRGISIDAVLIGEDECAVKGESSQDALSEDEKDGGVGKNSEKTA